MVNNDVRLSTAHQTTSPDLFDRIPDENILQIFLNLPREDIASARRVSRRWNAIAHDKTLIKAVTVKENAIGAEKWNEYLGEVDKVLPLPKNIYEILESDCPFWEGKKVKETHMLVLIPSKIKGVGSDEFEDFTLNKLRGLVKNPKKGEATDYQWYWQMLEDEIGDSPVKNPYWVLMTKDILPKSQNKPYDDQMNLALNEEEGRRAPTVLEAATCLLINNFVTGKRLFSDWTFTSCQEKISDRKTVVGSFMPTGIYVFYNPDSFSDGVASLRDFGSPRIKKI